MHPVPWRSYALLTASTCLVGSYVGLSKLLVLAFPVFLLAGMRFGIAAVLMAGWLKKPAHEAPLDARSKGLLFLESFLGNFLFSICMLFGLRQSSAVVAGVILAGIPAAVALLSRVFLRERLGGRTLAGIACAVGGIALVATGRQGGADTTPLGALLLVAAVFCEAAYVVIGKQLTAGLGPRRISALINLWGLVLVAPLAIWQAFSFDFTTPHALDWGLLGYYAATASVITVWLWMAGLQGLPASQAGVFMVFLPISTALVGLALGETVSAQQALAYGLALSGVLLATWPRRTAPR
ncbi:DMT family transporter [Roseateles sp. DC23W]|uniref:DMT family transporter n=1 Tax=Pelomonas dachongensis TaxID=3299029 RepID=A0ABW7EJX8_9BURK